MSPLSSNRNAEIIHVIMEREYTLSKRRHKPLVDWSLRNAAAILTLKHRETHGCVVSLVATDALVLKHQAISIHNAD